MSTIVQVCVVIMTLAVIAMAIAAWRVVKKIEELARQAAPAIDDVRRTTREAQHVISAAQDTMRGVQHGVERFQEFGAQVQRVGDRAVQVSHLVLDEVERPARGAIALVRGVCAGAAALLGKRAPHFSTHRFNGGERHVGP